MNRWLLCLVAAAACHNPTPLEPTQDDVDVEEPTPAEPAPLGNRDVAGITPPLGPPYPIVLVHGFSGFGAIAGADYFFGVEDDLIERGEDVTAPALPPYAPSSERALVLARVVDDVLTRTGKARVHLIGHSQGGLDCRTLVTEHAEYLDRVATITTISTPHMGTALAAAARYTPDGVINPAGRFLAWVLGGLESEPPSDASWNTDEDTDAEYDAELAAAIAFMDPANMAIWNDSHVVPAELPFFSVAGVSNLRSLNNDVCDGVIWSGEGRVDAIDPLMLSAGAVLSLSDGGSLFSPTPTDGIVPTASGRYGTFLGCVPADHFDEVGQLIDLTSGLVSGFDHIEFLRSLVAHAHAAVPITNGP
jgi:triacylglycerol lipase